MTSMLIVLVLCEHTYKHTDRQTDTQTHRNTDALYHPLQLSSSEKSVQSIDEGEWKLTL